MLGTNHWAISYPVSACAKPFTGLDGEFKYFSTKEKADDYVLMNKTCLSLKDIYEHGVSETCVTDHGMRIWYAQLQQLVKDRIKNK